MTIGMVAALRNARLDAITTDVGANGYLRIYNGSRPATGGTATTLLAELRTNATAFAAAASGGVLTLNAITQDSSADATGTATWYRVLRSNGTTISHDGSVGTSAADLILNTTSIVATGVVAISSGTYTEGNP